MTPQRLDWYSLSVPEFTLCPLHTSHGYLAWGVCGSLNSSSGGVSNSFTCYCDPSTSTGLSLSALIYGFDPILIVSFYALFS